MHIKHDNNETSKQIKLDPIAATILHSELAQIRAVCEEGTGWCKRDIGRAIARLQDIIAS